MRRTDNPVCVPAVQYAALPWRKSRGRNLEILLVTTRRTRRWIVPKGWPIEGSRPCDCAAREAFEEAGVLGVVAAEPLGSFPYDKTRKGGDVVRCSVELFPLNVTHRRRSWPEKSMRETRWCAIDEALTLASDKGLRRLISRFAENARAPRKRAVRSAAA